MLQIKDSKELPSSDAETDRMEGMDERDSQLEQLSKDNKEIQNKNINNSNNKENNEDNNLNRLTSSGSTSISTDTIKSNDIIEPSTSNTIISTNDLISDKKRKLEEEEEGGGEVKEMDNGREKDNELNNKKIKIDDQSIKSDNLNINDKDEQINNIKDNDDIKINTNNVKIKQIDEETKPKIEVNNKISMESTNNNVNNNSKNIKHLDDNKVNEEEEEPENENEDEDEDEDEGEEDQEEEQRKLEEKHKEERELEEQQRENNRVSAMNQLKDIEILFAQLKDKLYETQLNKLKFELKLCQSNKHPELLEYMKMVDDDFEKKAERLMNLQKYKLKCLDNQTRAYRVALHQQFMKNCQDLKNKEVVKITTDWYDINKERRTMDMQTLKLPNYYQFNQTINSSNIDNFIPNLVNQRNSVYKELSILQGLVDFKQMIPSSLNNLKGCSEDEVNNDLKEMGLI